MFNLKTVHTCSVGVCAIRAVLRWSAALWAVISCWTSVSSDPVFRRGGLSSTNTKESYMGKFSGQITCLEAWDKQIWWPKVCAHLTITLVCVCWTPHFILMNACLKGCEARSNYWALFLIPPPATLHTLTKLWTDGK